jgi:hypothetical protein
MKTIVSQASIIRRASFNNLSKDVFLRGLLDKDIVKNIKEILTEIEEVAKKIQIASSARDYDAFVIEEEKVFDLSNKYYELTCPVDFAFSRMVTLNTDYLVKAEILKVDLIYDFEHITKLLFAA